MIAASYKSSNLSTIYHGVVVQQVPSLVSASTIAATGNTIQSDKKRKQDSIPYINKIYTDVVNYY